MPYIIALIFGLLAAFGALLMELLFSSLTVSTPALTQGVTAFTPTFFSLLVLALIEELSKIILFLKSARFNQNPYNPILFASCFGIGFASLEYFTLSFLEIPLSSSLIGILCVHIITSLIIIFLLKKTPTKRQILITLAIATLIHFSYNALL